MTEEPQQCAVCEKPFEKDDRGRPKIGYAFCKKARHYVGLCGACLIARKANMGFHRKGKYVGPMAGISHPAPDRAPKPASPDDATALCRCGHARYKHGASGCNQIVSWAHSSAWATNEDGPVHCACTEFTQP